MKRERLNSASERDLVVGLITSDNFCKEIVPILDSRNIEIDYVRIISEWIKGYFDEFGKAPGRDIIKLYRSHVSELKDESLQENILSFIEKLNHDYESISNYNDAYAIDQTIRYLKNKSLKNLSQDIEAYVDSGEMEKAESLITKYRKVERNQGQGVSLLEDSEIILSALTEEKDKLFSFEGDYGKLMGDINREDFIAFLAPMKAGKTFQLIDCGIEALKHSLKVVMFSLEMSRSAMIKRTWKSLSGQVTEDIEVEIPYFVKDGEKFRIESKTIRKKASSVLDVEKKQKSLRRLFRGGNFRIYAEPAYSLTVEKLEIKLDDLEHEGFIPDVIIIDYADIMMPSDSRQEYRNQIDGIWKRLRALAQKRKCAVFTASQTNRSALNGPVEAESIAEDVRKIAHVTSMVSISRPKICKENSIAIFGQLAIRDGEPVTRKVIATQCLAFGRPVIESHWENDVELDVSEDENEVEKKIYKGRNKK